MHEYHSDNLILYISCILFTKIFTDCLIDDKDFVRPGNMKNKTKKKTQTNTTRYIIKNANGSKHRSLDERP